MCVYTRCEHHERARESLQTGGSSFVRTVRTQSWGMGRSAAIMRARLLEAAAAAGGWAACAGGRGCMREGGRVRAGERGRVVRPHGVQVPLERPAAPHGKAKRPCQPILYAPRRRRRSRPAWARRPAPARRACGAWWLCVCVSWWCSCCLGAKKAKKGVGPLGHVNVMEGTCASGWLHRPTPQRTAVLRRARPAGTPKPPSWEGRGQACQKVDRLQTRRAAKRKGITRKILGGSLLPD